MSDLPLPSNRYGPETYIKSIDNLVERYWNEKEPIHYKKAAIGMNETTCSSCLKYFRDIGLIEAEKAGVYIPGDEVIGHFRKVGESKRNATERIDNILDKYKLYSEAKFLINNGQFDVSELATEIAGQLGLDKESVDRVEKAIRIFAELDLFALGDEDGVSISISSSTDPGVANQNDDKITENSSSQKTESSKTSLDSFVIDKDSGDRIEEIDESEIDLPSTRGNPDKLLNLVDALSEGGNPSVDELSERYDASSNTIKRQITYGQELGFIKSSEEGVGLTESGFNLSFASNEKETARLFLDAIKNNQSYRTIIARLLTEFDPEKAQFDHTIALRELRTTFGFTDVTEDTLKRSITTLFQTLAAGNIGEYVRGRGPKPTRLELSSDGLQRLQHIVLQTSEAPKSNSEPTVESHDQEDDVEAPEKDSKVDSDTDSSEQRSTTDQSESSSGDSRGPSLRISKFRIQNFRNVRDSGWIELDNITTLIGKNESGKTSTLEAIEYFNSGKNLPDKDLSNDVGAADKENKIPIISLEFILNREELDKYYPDFSSSENVELPIQVQKTRFSDGTYETASSDIPEELAENFPSPDTLYYKQYSTIEDEATLNEIENGECRTFENLLKIGGLNPEKLRNEGLQLYNDIEDAENKIEQRLNNAWSQKSLNVKIRWDSGTETLRLLIQDRISSENLQRERSLTFPSQRSEGFQWFLSFFINLIAETESSGEGTKILLLDDPAVKLHPEGKQDWLNSVNEIGKEEQVIFSSHSPYLIDKRFPSRIRTVEDTPNNGTKIKQDIFGADSDTLEPLRNALGINLGSSPFVSGRQLLVEGPTEYYVISAVANYFSEVLNRDIFDWRGVSIMPVRGASRVIGTASWLASEEIDYAILLDRDEEGEKTRNQIESHHADIDVDRVVLLENMMGSEEVVTEDLFAPELYVEAFNAEYIEYTSEVSQNFEPAGVAESDGMTWKIGGREYDGSRLDKLLEDYLENQDVAEQLENSNGEIELRKRQIAERISSRLNNSTIEEDWLNQFNRLFARVNSALDV